MHLNELGWTTSLDKDFGSYQSLGLIPARIAEEHKGRYLVFSELGTHGGEITGKLRFGAASRLDFPAVGDWVAAQVRPDDPLAVIHAVLARRTTFLRKIAGEVTEPQVVATNVDFVFLVTDLGLDFNLRRLERYLTLAHESGAAPIVVLNKADICPEFGVRTAEVGAIAPGVPVHAVSAASGEGMDGLRDYAAPGKTVALLGSSGVGKSTIINRLLGEDRLRTNAVREDDGRGRHTTTVRQLLLLPGGGIVIDTPGMREIRLWGDEDGLATSFEDIEALARGCRFSDCAHEGEPECGVRSALADGRLSAERWESFQKLRRELRFLERRQDTRAGQEERARWRRLHKMQREHYREKYGMR